MGVGRVSVFELIGGLHVLVRGVVLGGRCVRIWSLRLGSHHGRNGDVEHGVTTRTSIGYRFSSSLNICEIGRESLGNWLLTGWSLVRIPPGEPNKVKRLADIYFGFFGREWPPDNDSDNILMSEG